MSDFLPSSLADNDPVIEDARELYRNGDYEAVLARITDGMDQTADPVGLRLLKAMAERRLGKQRVAISELESLLKESVERLDVAILLGLCLRDVGRREQAAEMFDQVLSVDPEHATAKYQFAVVAQELGKHELAIQHFTDYVASDEGQDNALAWSLLGISYRQTSNFEKSESAIETAIVLDPKDIPTRNALVITLFQAGKQDQALDPARQALEMKDSLATRNFHDLVPRPELVERASTFDPADRNKNVISFSLWGDDPVYTHGSIVNAQIAPHIYPGWRCRFYCDQSVPEEIRGELARLGADVRMIGDPKIKNLKSLWRFLVSDDPDVERFICRDADSRLNAREAVAVDEWVKSGLPFHVMRDHIYHMEVMLAGMWGGVTRVLPNVKALSEGVNTYRPNRWNDQEFLRDVVWPMIRDRALVHDSVFQFRGAKDFPKRCELPGKIHVGGAIKSMPAWPVQGLGGEQKSQK